LPGHVVWGGLLTPDSRSLVFWTFNGQTAQDVWVVDLSNKEAPRPIAHTAREYGVTLSPDGEWVAYQSDESGPFEIYARRLADGDTGRRVTVSVGGGQEPLWSHDGSEMFYRSNDSLFAVPVEFLGNDLRAGTPRALFADAYGRNMAGEYDVTPDGQEFVFVAPRRFGIRVEQNALHEFRDHR
jgi:serine/threonine-protein kinase